jgi:hypothetical protein
MLEIVEKCAARKPALAGGKDRVRQQEERGPFLKELASKVFEVSQALRQDLQPITTPSAESPKSCVCVLGLPARRSNRRR